MKTKDKINQLDEMLKFGNTRREIVNRAKEIIQEREKEILKIIDEIFKDESIYTGRVVKFEIKNRIKGEKDTKEKIAREIGEIVLDKIEEE